MSDPTIGPRVPEPPQGVQGAQLPRGKEKPQVGDMGGHKVSGHNADPNDLETVTLMKECKKLMADLKGEPPTKFKASPIKIGSHLGYKPLPKRAKHLIDYGGLPKEPKKSDTREADESTAVEEEAKGSGYKGLPSTPPSSEEAMKQRKAGYGVMPSADTRPRSKNELPSIDRRGYGSIPQDPNKAQRRRVGSAPAKLTGYRSTDSIREENKAGALPSYKEAMKGRLPSSEEVTSEGGLPASRHGDITLGEEPKKGRQGYGVMPSADTRPRSKSVPSALGGIDRSRYGTIPIDPNKAQRPRVGSAPAKMAGYRSRESIQAENIADALPSYKEAMEGRTTSSERPLSTRGKTIDVSKERQTKQGARVKKMAKSVRYAIGDLLRKMTAKLPSIGIEKKQMTNLLKTRRSKMEKQVEKVDQKLVEAKQKLKKVASGIVEKVINAANDDTIEKLGNTYRSECEPPDLFEAINNKLVEINDKLKGGERSDEVLNQRSNLLQLFDKVKEGIVPDSDKTKVEDLTKAIKSNRGIYLEDKGVWLR